MSVQQGSLLEVLKKKMRGLKDDLETALETANEYKLRALDETRRREEVRLSFESIFLDHSFFDFLRETIIKHCRQDHELWVRFHPDLLLLLLLSFHALMRRQIDQELVIYVSTCEVPFKVIYKCCSSAKCESERWMC